MAVTYLVADTDYTLLISLVTFIMALLVAQTRIEAGVHSVFETFAGGFLGALVTLVVFQVFWA
jgi:diacylglycerol kinase (ATP)